MDFIIHKKCGQRIENCTCRDAGVIWVPDGIRDREKGLTDREKAIYRCFWQWVTQCLYIYDNDDHLMVNPKIDRIIRGASRRLAAEPWIQDKIKEMTDEEEL